MKYVVQLERKERRDKARVLYKNSNCLLQKTVEVAREVYIRSPLRGNLGGIESVRS